MPTWTTDEQFSSVSILTDEQLYVPGWIADEEISAVGFDTDEAIDVEDHDLMGLRIHNYSLNPDYDFDLEYWRDGAWTSMKDRVISSLPIHLSLKYREIYTAALILNNEDGALTP